MTQSSSAARRHTGVWVDTQTTYYKWFVAGTVLLAGATQTFAGNSVNLAIPRIMAAFGTDLTTTQWVTTSFLITRTLMVPILGWLGGFLGNRNLFICSMLGFVVASIGCGVAVNIPMLIAFRLMQGLVLGPLEGLTVILLINTFPPHQRGLAIGMRTIGWSTGQIVSFTIGGYLLEEVSWRMVRNIGASLGVTVSSVIFESFRLRHQLQAYTGYDPASPEHRALFSEITQSLRAAGINESDVGTMALRVIRQQMSVEAVTASFRDTFFAISFCFLLAMIPMFFVSRRMTRREI
jgi:MFS family permease